MLNELIGIVIPFLTQFLVPFLISLVVLGFQELIAPLIPYKYLIYKRVFFWIKVKTALCELHLSIKLRKIVSLEDLEDKLKPFLDRRKVRDFQKTDSELRFNSFYSASSYTVSTVEDDDQQSQFVVIKLFNPFSIGALANIKNLDESLEEVRELADLFSSERLVPDKLTVHIALTPRYTKYFESRLRGQFNEGAYEYGYDSKNLTIVNTGTAQVEKSISKTIEDWMCHFV